MKHISKYLSLVLRHQPEIAGITLDQWGWTDIEPLLAAIRDKYGEFSREDLDALVQSSDKQRFVIEGDRIRANQGHSVEVDLALEAVSPPPILYHGTQESRLSSIMSTGLNRGERHHVHLSADEETARIVGSRRSGPTVILSIHTTNMPGEFYCSANGVWLTSDVPPEFISHP